MSERDGILYCDGEADLHNKGAGLKLLCCCICLFIFFFLNYVFYFFFNYMHGCWGYVPLIVKSCPYIIWGASIIKLVGKTIQIPKKGKPQCENTNIHKRTYILQMSRNQNRAKNNQCFRYWRILTLMLFIHTMNKRCNVSPRNSTENSTTWSLKYLLSLLF